MAINNNALASSQATVLSEDGNTLYATIQMRHGKEADMDKSKFVPAEIGVCTDSKKAVVAFAPNDTKEIAFKEDLSNNYGDLENKPSIGGVELDGNKTLEQLGIQPEGDYLTKVPDGYVKDDELEEQLTGKLDKNQGTENAGKMLVVGDDGNVQVDDEPVEVDSTLTQPGQAADALETGHRIDRKAPAIAQDAFGYGGVITDSAEASLQGLKVYGASRQFTTTGAQLLDIPTLLKDTSDVTISEDGYEITFEFTIQRGEDDSSPIFKHITTNLDLDLDLFGKTVTFSIDSWETNVSGETAICAIRYIESGKESYTYKTIYYNNNNNITFSIPENISNVSIQLVGTNATASSVTTGSYTVKFKGLMLAVSDSVIPWEPYTGGKPAPNPDYPQEIEIPGSDGQINISVDDQTITLQTPNGLPGIPVTSGGNYTDSEGQQWVCDEIDLERGKYVQRVKKARLTGEIYDYEIVSMNRYSIEVGNIFGMIERTRSPVMTSVQSSSFPISSSPDLQIFQYATNIYWYCVDRFSSKEELENYINENDITIVAKLATPIETDLTPEEIAAYKALRTNYPTTTVMTDTDPQVTLDMQYAVDTKTYIDNKIAEYVQSAISNSLLSTNTEQALSAPMGAELSNRIETLEQKLESEEE